MKRETLNAFFTARTDRLLCMSSYAYTIKLCILLNQNLITQATESGKWYSRSTVFNDILEGQMEHFVARVVWLLSNNPLSSKLCTHFMTFTSVKLQQPTILLRQALYCPWYSTLVTRSLRIHRYWTLLLVKKKKKKMLDSTNRVSSKSIESRLCTCAVECYEYAYPITLSWTCYLYGNEEVKW